MKYLSNENLAFVIAYSSVFIASVSLIVYEIKKKKDVDGKGGCGCMCTFWVIGCLSVLPIMNFLEWIGRPNTKPTTTLHLISSKKEIEVEDSLVPEQYHDHSGYGNVWKNDTKHAIIHYVVFYEKNGYRSARVPHGEIVKPGEYLHWWDKREDYFWFQKPTDYSDIAFKKANESDFSPCLMFIDYVSNIEEQITISIGNGETKPLFP